MTAADNSSVFSSRVVFVLLFEMFVLRRRSFETGSVASDRDHLALACEAGTGFVGVGACVKWLVTHAGLFAFRFSGWFSVTPLPPPPPPYLFFDLLRLC